MKYKDYTVANMLDITINPYNIIIVRTFLTVFPIIWLPFYEIQILPVQLLRHTHTKLKSSVIRSHTYRNFIYRTAYYLLQINGSDITHIQKS